jgi:hypothetical protein
MTSLRYLAITDDDLNEPCRYLPLRALSLDHLAPEARQAVPAHEIVVLHRPDGRRMLKNSWDAVATPAPEVWP